MSAPDLAELTHELLKAARAAGADQADALAVRGTALSVDIRQGQLEQAERAEGTDIGLRVLIGQRQACVSASDISAVTIAALAERAVAMAREAPEDAATGLADPGDLAALRDSSGLELEDGGADPDAAALEAAARGLEAAALEAEGITQAEASATFSRRALHLAQSNGFAGGYGRSGHSRSVVAFCGSGTAMERDYAGEARPWATDLPDGAGIGRLAAERALQRLGAVKPPTGTFPVLYDERIASSLIGHLLGAINGEAVARGASWARDLLDQPVLPAGVSLREDPLRKRGSSSRIFDAEGLATSAKDFVADGVLTSWVLDLATARRLKLRPTANAMRGPSAPPSPGTTNLELTPGTASRDDLIAQMGTGLLVTSLIGSTINPTTGDYSRGASGWWVEKGRLSHPVHECTIAGNLRDMLRRIVQANDARQHLAIRVPSILIDGMTIAGV
ncbi:TldD/PmbA family protein [Rhodobacter sp. 24-YEA-8]|uniref:TldD/PmbA family protein n=1 Tax=Rhodobacter sp. 24-YEA-8 TaxID=1884310 RepID=UPI0008978CCD|nr:TldD/PmbA family protein [Rhodobacter sp. 24-YEA-8]SEC51017.1 microcin-processing peptidase 1. Unknown type peptidase. MEROPS family U62 [Rhodobacter sp. 24-YEA-8]